MLETNCDVQLDSRRLIVGELQLSSGVLVVVSGLGGAGLGVVRQDDGAAGAGVTHHRHLHGAHALAHPHHALAEREDSGVVVVQDGHRGDQGLDQASFGGGARLVALEHPLGVSDTQVQQPHEEMLVLLEDVVVDDADLETHRDTDNKMSVCTGLFVFNEMKMQIKNFQTGQRQSFVMRDSCRWSLELNTECFLQKKIDFDASCSVSFCSECKVR